MYPKKMEDVTKYLEMMKMTDKTDNATLVKALRELVPSTFHWQEKEVIAEAADRIEELCSKGKELLMSAEMLAATCIPEQWGCQQTRLYAQKKRMRPYIKDFNAFHDVVHVGEKEKSDE